MSYYQSICHRDALLISDCDLGRDCRVASSGFRAQPDCCGPQAVERALGWRRGRGLQPYRVRTRREIVERVTDDLSCVVDVVGGQQDPAQRWVDESVEVAQSPGVGVSDGTLLT